jgi:pyrroline-5-carboxylate reductase
MNTQTIGFIGAGNMARALASGLINNGWQPEKITLSDPDPDARDALQRQLKVKVFEQNADVVMASDIVVFAVKPQVLHPVAAQLTDAIQKKQPLIISIAAGVRSDDLERWLGGNLSIIRAMPNTAALVGSGATGLYANSGSGDNERNIAESILRAVGVVAWVSDEDHLDVVTALSGSGPAYYFLIMEAMEQAAIDLGLNADTARLLTLETAFGAAKMALEGGDEPSVLRKQVTSKGGTTERALEVMEENNLRNIVRQALAAAVERSKELAKLLGKD